MFLKKYESQGTVVRYNGRKLLVKRSTYHFNDADEKPFLLTLSLSDKVLFSINTEKESPTMDGAKKNVGSTFIE